MPFLALLAVMSCSLCSVFGDVPYLPQKAYVGLSTMAMGDCSACEYAQCSHLSVLRGHSVFGPGELNTLVSPVPRGCLHIGVIIDDLIVLERIAAGWLETPEPRPQTRGDAVMGQADAAYAGAALISNPSKAFQNQTKAKLWGVELDGVRGVVRPASTRLWPLVAITLRVIALGLCTCWFVDIDFAAAQVLAIGHGPDLCSSQR